MRIDTMRADGMVYFFETYFEFKSRRPCKEEYDFKINYDDIKEIINSSGIKKTVTVLTNNGNKHSFYMYKNNTFIALINAGRNRNIIEEKPSENSPKQISPKDLDTLTKLNQLHKDGVLTEKELAQQKEIIMKKYR